MPVVLNEHIDLQGLNTTRILSWCLENLNDHEWDMMPISLFPLVCRFSFDCEETKLLVVLALDNFDRLKYNF